MVLKEIAFLLKHTRASGQRILGSFHGADVCLRPVRSRGRESMAPANCADRWCQSSSLRQSLPIFHAMPPATATSRTSAGPAKTGERNDESGARNSDEKSSGKSVIDRLLTLKCLLLYTADHHRLAVPPSAPSGTRSQTGQSLRP